ncbi:MAG: pantoate--beta-alanine ligase, partial [Candidatus Krumholzibacteriota bacterium]|nr:pantoate--beta-alanine ligase [Candidatus Krumholzibacteriota bacterium]
GCRKAESLRRIIRTRMEEAGFEVDYAEVARAETLEPVEELEGTVLLAAAGRLGDTRLIDNIALKINGDEVEEIVLQFPEWSRYDGR